MLAMFPAGLRFGDMTLGTEHGRAATVSIQKQSEATGIESQDDSPRYMYRTEETKKKSTKGKHEHRNTNTADSRDRLGGRLRGGLRSTQRWRLW